MPEDHYHDSSARISAAESRFSTIKEAMLTIIAFNSFKVGGETPRSGTQKSQG